MCGGGVFQGREDTRMPMADSYLCMAKAITVS